MEFYILRPERVAEIKRTTNETRVEIMLNLEGNNQACLDTGLPFWEHMLEQWTRHGQFELEVSARGDLQIDEHHLVEDLGLGLGAAFNQALGEKKDIHRYGSCLLPMDDALVLVSIDLSGRPFLKFELPLPAEKVGTTDTELVEEFCRALVNEGRFNLHIKLIHGYNAHHIIEALFKGLGRAMGDAAGYRGDTGDIPSTKGRL